MIEILSDMNSTGVAGVPVDLKHIVTDNLISQVEKYNKDLGMAGDDYHAKFQNFIDSVSRREFDIININDIAKNEYKAYDLSIEDSYVSPFSKKLIDFLAMGFKITSKVYFKSIDNENMIVKDNNGKNYINIGKKYTIDNYIKDKK